MTTEPTGTLDPRFSDSSATARPWSEMVALLESSEVFWLSTVRRDGRPHVSTLLAGWLDDAMVFVTGGGEQKAKNLEANAACVLTTGTNTFNEGVDVVVEGRAARLTDENRLQQMVEMWKRKYDWDWTVADGTLVDPSGEQTDPGLVFAVRPRKVIAFGKGESFSQTSYRFD